MSNAPPGFPPLPENAPAQKKGGNGCLIAALVVGALVVLVGVVVVAVIGVLATSPEGKALTGVIKDAATAADQPGAKALTGNGCGQAMVFQTGKLAELVAMTDAGVSGDMVDEVICAAPTKTCDELAAIYVGAQRPTRPFHVTAHKDDGTGDKEATQVCEGTYEANGQKRP